MKKELLKKIQFAFGSIMLAAMLSIISDTTAMIIGGIIALITYIKLSVDEYEIEYRLVKLGWSMITYSIFVLFMLIPFGQVVWMAIAGAVITGIYTYIPILSQKMGLCKYRFGCGRNGVLIWIWVFTGMVFIAAYVKSEMKKDQQLEAEYAKAEFVEIQSITKELYHGNTFYAVVTETGETFFVDAREHPQIRRANETNKVKYVIDNNTVYGLQKPFKLELK